MKKYLLIITVLLSSTFAGWFFLPGAYWTFQDGGIGFLYAQGEHFENKFGWTIDTRYAFAGDYWIDTELRAKFLGEMTTVHFDYCVDSLEIDYRKPNIAEEDTAVDAPYDVQEYSVYLKQKFLAGRSSKFSIYAGYKRGEYTSPYVYTPSAGAFEKGEESKEAEAIDIGLHFALDSREDPENPQTAYYFGARLGGLIFPNSDIPDFDYMDPTQFTDPESDWPPKASGYIELDQRFFGKLDVSSVPFPLILALRIGGGHHITEVPQLVAFQAGRDDFLRGVDKRHLMGTSYYIMSGELRAQIWEESYTPWVFLHWLIPGYENPRPILEIVPIVEAARVYGDYIRDDKQQMTFGMGLHWVFTDYTVFRFDVCYWNTDKKWGAYLSFEPSI